MELHNEQEIIFLLEITKSWFLDKDLWYHLRMIVINEELILKIKLIQRVILMWEILSIKQTNIFFM